MTVSTPVCCCTSVAKIIGAIRTEAMGLSPASMQSTPASRSRRTTSIPLLMSSAWDELTALAETLDVDFHRDHELPSLQHGTEAIVHGLDAVGGGVDGHAGSPVMRAPDTGGSAHRIGSWPRRSSRP